MYIDETFSTRDDVCVYLVNDERIGRYGYIYVLGLSLFVFG